MVIASLPGTASYFIQSPPIVNAGRPIGLVTTSCDQPTAGRQSLPNSLGKSSKPSRTLWHIPCNVGPPAMQKFVQASYEGPR